MRSRRLSLVLLTAALALLWVQRGMADVIGENDGASAPGRSGEMVATGDFNRDGIADIVSAGPHVLSVLLGQQDGTFRPAKAYKFAGETPRAVVVKDFDGDGNLDVMVGDEDGAIFEFAGNGRGDLNPPREVAKLGSVVSIAAGAFTRDHKVDLVVSDKESNSAVVLLGAGDGTFRQAWSFSLPQSGKEFRLAAVDFNGDGITDIVINSEDDDGNYEVMLGTGNGTFTYAPQLSHLRDPNSYCPS